MNHASTLNFVLELMTDASVLQHGGKVCGTVG